MELTYLKVDLQPLRRRQCPRSPAALVANSISMSFARRDAWCVAGFRSSKYSAMFSSHIFLGFPLGRRHVHQCNMILWIYVLFHASHMPKVDQRRVCNRPTSMISFSIWSYILCHTTTKTNAELWSISYIIFAVLLVTNNKTVYTLCLKNRTPAINMS